MAYTNLLPRTQNITGADLSGTDGTANRTYTIPDTGVLSSGIDLVVNGTTLMEGAGNDFTIASEVITFLNIIDDVDIIRVTYWIAFGAPSEASLSTSTSLKYATPLMLADALGIRNKVPSRAVAGTPSNELLGTGDDSETIFYLDQENILSDTYTFYYGAAATATDELTETTHYTLDKDTGKLTLTTAGVTLLSTNKLYAAYSYISNGMTNSYFISIISRAEKEVDGAVNTTFTDQGTTNPAYPLEIEYQPSEGVQHDRIIVSKKPLKDVTCPLNGDITAAATTLDLASGSGGGDNFPSSGYMIIGSEVMTYTGITDDAVTGLSRGVLGTTAATHDNADAVHSTVLLRSNTTEGTAVSWTVQPWDTSMHATEEGLMYVFKDADPTPLTRDGVANRIKIIYLYGEDTVPGDITRLTIIYAKRALAQDNISKALIGGRNEFRPEMFNVDQPEIDRIVNRYIVLPMGNT